MIFAISAVYGCHCISVISNEFCLAICAVNMVVTWDFWFKIQSEHSDSFSISLKCRMYIM